ncbi:hypothetical protein OROGR_000400 [Orobanche gracilis]
MTTHEMEGKSLSPNHFDLLKKIGELTRSIIEDLCNGRSPALRIDKFSSYCNDVSGNCCCSYDLPKGKEILVLRRESQARRLDALLRVLLIVQQLLRENKHGSKRDIYYMHPSVFKVQSPQLECGNGLVMGWLRFAEAGRIFDCINSPNMAHHIPVHVEDVEDIISVSEYILVVEKESVFQRLANDHFCRQNRCIVGRGYPDIPTRRFLHLLMEKLLLPVYCLVDCDPYGIDILTTYRFGSMHMSYDSKSLRLPEMRWLGALPSDCQRYQLPEQCFLPLTAEESERSELQLLLDRGVKFEIEALSAHSITFLAENYLPSKIRGGEFI